jgi:hypothetical protein
MTLYEDSSDLISADNVQAGESRMKIPSSTFYFQQAVPLICNRVVSRVHISDWNMVNLFMMMERRASDPLGWNILYFCFEGKGEHIFQVLNRSNTLKTILFRVSKGCFMFVTMYERSSKHLRKTKKENGNMSWPEQEGLPPKYVMKWNPLKWDIEA